MRELPGLHGSREVLSLRDTVSFPHGQTVRCVYLKVVGAGQIPGERAVERVLFHLQENFFCHCWRQSPRSVHPLVCLN